MPTLYGFSAFSIIVYFVYLKADMYSTQNGRTFVYDPECEFLSRLVIGQYNYYMIDNQS